jgi:hypothetical protein
MESLQEMSDAMSLCNREMALYQDPTIADNARAMYVEVFECIRACIEEYRRPAAKTVLPFVQTALPRKVERSMERIRKLSRALLREVDYQHRLELRRTSQRLVEMQIEQKSIFRALEDQKRLLESLQEEKNLMGLIQEQQKTTQVLQDIQRRICNRIPQELL